MGMYKCPTHGIGDNPFCCDLVTKNSGLSAGRVNPTVGQCLTCGHEGPKHTLVVDGSSYCDELGCECANYRGYKRRIPSRDTVEHDPVNHPSHYTAYSGLEIIDLTEQMNFNRGNAVKYITRAGFKGDDKTEIEDLKKARWYLDREIERITPLKRLTKEWADDG